MKTIPILMFMAAFAIVSCEKADDNNPQKIVVKKLASLKQTSLNADFNASIINLEYYSDGKLKKIDQINKAIIEYEYSGNSVIEKDTIYDEGITVTTKYNLNSNGRATSATDPSTYSFEYDSQGYLVKESNSFTNYVDCLISEIKNGNVASVTYTQNGKPMWTHTYEYYTDKYCTFNYNQTGSTFHVRVGLDFLGVGNKNLVKRSVLNDLGSTVTYDYSYVYNSDGDITRMIVSSTGGVIVNVDFTYI